MGAALYKVGGLAATDDLTCGCPVARAATSCSTGCPSCLDDLPDEVDDVERRGGVGVRQEVAQQVQHLGSHVWEAHRARVDGLRGGREATWRRAEKLPCWVACHGCFPARLRHEHALSTLGLGSAGAGLQPLTCTRSCRYSAPFSSSRL